MQYWLIKSEPFKYSWNDLIKDKSTFWDGVRNYAARNHMRSMKLGDLALYYHSNEGKEIVGYVKIVKEAYPDPTIDDDRWSAVDVEPVRELAKYITLKQIKSDEILKGMELVRIGRLSVTPVTKDQFDRVLKLSEE